MVYFVALPSLLFLHYSWKSEMWLQTIKCRDLFLNTCTKTERPIKIDLGYNVGVLLYCRGILDTRRPRFGTIFDPAPKKTRNARPHNIAAQELH